MYTAILLKQQKLRKYIYLEEEAATQFPYYTQTPLNLSPPPTPF